MIWLWTLPPLVVVCAAIGVLTVTRRAARLRGALDADRGGPWSPRLGAVHDRLAQLRDELDRWPAPDDERDAGPTER